MKIRQVVDYLDEVFRPELQEDYDNSGFLIGDGDNEYKGALVTLDVTMRVVNEAAEAGLNLIVAHHPLIFKGMKRVTDRDELGRMVLRLAALGISVYAAHTNLDNLAWGVSGALCKRLGLINTRILRPMRAGDESTGSGMVGELEQGCAADLWLAQVKQQLGLPIIRCSHHAPDKTIRRVALCGGAGGFLIPDAVKTGADIYLTSDLKYHDFQLSEGGMILADIGHYESEQFAKEIIFSRISEKFSNFACRISACQNGIVEYI